MRRGPGVFKGLSRNPKASLFQEAQRILDNFDDELDEVGVTLPEEYQADASSMSEIRQYYSNLGVDLSRQVSNGYYGNLGVDLSEQMG